MTATSTTRALPDRLSTGARQILDWTRRGLRRVAAGGEMSAASSLAQWMLISLAALAVWIVVFGTGLSALSEHHTQHDLFVKLREQLADGTAPLGGAVKEGAPVAMLDSSAAGLHNVVVVEGTSSRDLEAGPGHLPDTVLPGQPGVSWLLGRSLSFGGPFSGITHVRVGDIITATTGEGVFVYVVADVVGSKAHVTIPGGTTSAMVLVTSQGSGWRSGWAPTHAVYVYAVLKGTPAGLPSTAGVQHRADAPMASDASGLYQLVLWLQLLLLTVVLIIVARHRWSGVWQVWLIGTPVLLAALWGMTASMWPLLPNLI